MPLPQRGPQRRAMPSACLLHQYASVWGLVCCCMIFLRVVEATTESLVAAYDGNSGTYVVNPAGNAATANSVSRPLPVCTAVDAVRVAQQTTYDHPLSLGTYGARIACLSVSGKGTASCTQSPSILASSLIMRKHGETTDVLPPDVITLAQLFNGSIEETFFSATYLVDMFLRLTISSLVPTQTCSLDVVVASSIAPLSTQPAGGLADLPVVTNLDTTTRMWLVNSTSTTSPPQTATLFLRRLANAPPLVAPARFKFVMIQSNESCQAPNVVQATAANSPTGLTAYYSESVSNVLLKVQLSVPAQSGLYVLCGGKETSNANNTTTTTVMLSLAKLRCFENGPPAYVMPPLSWLGPNTVPSGGAPSSSWTVTFIGNALLSATTDSAAISPTPTSGGWSCSNTSGHRITANATYPLAQSSEGRVVWTVPLVAGDVISLCYRRGGAGWLDVPSYFALDVHSIDRLNENVSPPLPQPGGGTTTTPISTTPPPSTSTPLPTSSTPPAPTLSGGCATASVSVIAAFGSNSAVNFRTSGPWPLQVAAAFASFLSNKLCVSTNSISLVQLRINSVWYIQCVVYSDTFGSNGGYSGIERMAFTVFVLYNAIKQQLQDNYLVFGIGATTKIEEGATTSDDSPVAQLIVGVAVAAVVCAAVCLCGLGYLCCKRMRQANGGHRHNAEAAAAIPHIPQDGITVIPRSAVIQSHARVVLGTRSRRLEDGNNGSSTDSADSTDEVRSIATGHVVDGAGEHQRAPAVPSSPGGGGDDDDTINCDPSVYGPDSADQRQEYFPRTETCEDEIIRHSQQRALATPVATTPQTPNSKKQEDALNPKVADGVLDTTATSISQLSPLTHVSFTHGVRKAPGSALEQPPLQGERGSDRHGDIEMIEIRGDGDREEGEEEEAPGTMVTSIVVGAPPERSTRRTRAQRGDLSGVDMC